MDKKKKMGRPTANPRTSRLELRMSEADVEKLEMCCKITGFSKSDIIRMGIEKFYNEIKQKAVD